MFKVNCEFSICNVISPEFFMNSFYKILSVAVLPLAVTLPACKKGELAKPVTTGFKMYNADTVKIHLDLYRNWDDYVTGENIYASFDIDSRDSVTIPTSKLDPGNTYYFDWYNADYTHSNWIAHLASDNSFNTLTSSYHNCNAEASNVRNALLSGNQMETHWAAVDVYNKQGQSVYDTLQANQKFMEITFQKNWTAALFLKDSNRNQMPTTYRVGVYSDGPIFEIYFGYGGFLANTKAHTFDAGALQLGNQTTDSLLFDCAGFYYLLVKK